jgi:arylsulfatase A
MLSYFLFNFEFQFMTLRRFLSILAAGSVSVQSAPAQPALPVRPNFVVILIDDMGYGDIGPFGSSLNCTPRHRRAGECGL